MRRRRGLYARTGYITVITDNFPLQRYYFFPNYPNFWVKYMIPCLIFAQYGRWSYLNVHSVSYHRSFDRAINGINENNNIDFAAEKYGEHSYLIRVSELSIGEYGIIVNDPSMTGSKIQIVSCFGVGSVEEYNTSIKKVAYDDQEPAFEGD